MLSSMGFLEIKSNSLTKENYFKDDDNTVVKIHNPLSQDLSRLRQSLLPGGLEAVIYNINRKRLDLKLYEFGNCYFHNPAKEVENPQKKYSERFHLGIFLSGKFTVDNWATASDNASFYHLKSTVELLLKKLGIGIEKLKSREITNESYSQALELYIEKGTVITAGKIVDDLLKSFDIKQEVFVAEINWDLIMRMHKKHKLLFKPLSKFPEVKRDLSLMIDKSVRYEQLEELAFKAEKRILKQVSLFDIYEGEKIEDGKKSYALSFLLLDDEKTLTDKQIDKVMSRISESFEKELGAVIRGS
jgi:phenylalanyl-tRNA synthetase beta chain